MLTLLLWLACSGNEVERLSADGLAARDALVQELRNGDPEKVSRAAEHAAQWEGQDAQMDRLIGDALANVLMNPNDGFRLLRAHPKPGDESWERPLMSAASRTGDAQHMRDAWALVGRTELNFDHPVVGQVSQRMRADPSMHVDHMEDALMACQLLDSQPPVGRQPLDHPVFPRILDVVKAVGGTQVVVGRPIFRTDPDPQSGKGPLQCLKKAWIGRAWPDPLPRAFTIGLSNGVRNVYVDIRLENGEPWAYASSDAGAAGRWLEAMKLWETPNGPQRVNQRFKNGLWGVAPAGDPQ